MAERVFFELITSKEWRDGLASLLLEREKLLSNVYDSSLGRDPYLVLEDCLARGIKIPTWVGRRILNDRKRKKGGRHTRAEQRAQQLADDIACFLAVKDGMLNHRLLSTPAEARAGKAMNLSRQAVHGAYERQNNRMIASLRFQEPSEKK